MQLVCLDLEGVLVPEIWIEFSKRTGIPELSRTTRDEPDYDKLMTYRLDLLRTHKLGLPDIQKVISDMGPMAGAKDFLDALRRDYQVIILSDTFYEFAMPLMAAGDSYNDTAMLAEAHAGILFHPPQNVIDEFPQFPVTMNYAELRAEIDKASRRI